MKIIKETIFVLFMLVAMPQAMRAQNYYSTGYVGNIAGELGWDTFSTNTRNGLGLSVSHTSGYAFGQGTFIGVGTGVGISKSFGGAWAVNIPLFAEVQHEFINGRISPMAGLKLGIESEQLKSPRFLIVPSFGISIGRSSIYASLHVASNNGIIVEVDDVAVGALRSVNDHRFHFGYLYRF